MNRTVMGEFITGSNGRELLKEFNGIVEKDYHNAHALGVLFYDEEQQVLKGSSPVAAVIINRIVRNLNLHVATPADLEHLLAKKNLPFSNHYEDSALILRSEGTANQDLARGLLTQVENRQRNKFKTPCIIPLRYITLERDTNSSEGFKFSLADDAQIIYSDKLKSQKDCKKFHRTDDFGLPLFSLKGDRTWHMGASALSGLSLGRKFDLSEQELLTASYSYGRVVLVNDKAA